MDRKTLINKLIYYPEIKTDYNKLLKKRQEIINKKLDKIKENELLYNINNEIHLHEEKQILIDMIKSPKLSPPLSPPLRCSSEISIFNRSSSSSTLSSSSPECSSPLARTNNVYF